MAGVNKVFLIGNLGKDPEIRYTQGGAAVCSFTVATSEKWKDKNTGEQVEKTEWHRIVSFSKQAEILEKYLSKGSQIYLEGRLQTSKYEKEGQTHYSTDIVVSTFQFLGGKRDGAGDQHGGQQNANQNNQRQPQAQGQQSGQPPVDGYDPEDLPF